MVTSVALRTRSLSGAAKPGPASAPPASKAAASRSMPANGRVPVSGLFLRTKQLFAVHLVERYDVAIFIGFGNSQNTDEHDGDILDSLHPLPLHRDHDIFVHIGHVA